MPGDGWAAETAGLGCGGDEEFEALHRVLAPDLGARPGREPWWIGHVRTLARREYRTARTALAELFEALATAVPRAVRRPDADADERPLLVCRANAAAAVNTVCAAVELRGEDVTETLGRILDRTLSEPWAFESGRLRNACTRALVELGSTRATDLLVNAAASAVSKPHREQLLLCLDLAKRGEQPPPSRLSELHVPDHGLDGSGRMLLHAHHREYLIALEPGGEVTVRDQSADPTPDQAAERVLDTQIRAIRTTYRREVRRIEALLATERVWSAHEWRRIYQDHPITRSVANRLVWRQERTDGTVLEVLPGPFGGVSCSRSGDETRVSGAADDVHAPGTAISLWHPRDADPAALAAWRALRDERALVQPFEQIDRDFTLVEPDPDATELNQHTSSRVETVAFAQAVEALGWHSRRNRTGPSSDTIRLVYRDYPDAYMTIAVPCMEEGQSVVLGAGWFHRSEDRARTPLALGYVPPRVYSEALRDLAALARGAIPGESEVHDRVP